MATKIVTKNSSTASAVPTASDLVQGELAVNVADKRLFTEDNAGAIVELGTNPSGNVTFQDNGKAIFGAGDDLQIYHDGSNSYINDAGTGNLYLRASNAIIMQSADGAETIASFHDDNLCRLYFDNAEKLATTSTGIDVTGNLTMASGGSIVAGGANDLILNAGESGTPDIYLQSGSSTKVKIEGSDGSVGIGNSNPSAFNSLGATDKLVVGDSTVSNLTLFGTNYGSLAFADSNTSGSTAQYAGLIQYYHADNSMQFYTSSTERMRIDSSGNVGIGQSSPINAAFTTTLHIGNSSTGTAQLVLEDNDANGPWKIASNSSLIIADDTNERMRIDSSGNLLVGTTAASGTFTLVANQYNAMSIQVSSNGNVGASWKNASGSEVGYVQVNASATLYSTSSDERLKENITDADDAGSKIDAIQVRKYDWKADGSHQDYGMIAQELQAVAPEAVSGDADSEEMMGVDYSKLVPMLIKEIQSLRNRVAQLEE